MNSPEPVPLTARQSGPIQGRVRVPGDKSISHRSLILGALTVGESTITGLLEGEDVLHTADVMRALGARVERTGDQTWRVNGVGIGGVRATGRHAGFRKFRHRCAACDRRGGRSARDSNI